MDRFKEILQLTLVSSEEKFPLVKITQKQEVPEVVGKKIEGFLCCPFCGSHKKLLKAPIYSSGYVGRLRKIQKNEEAKEEIFKVRKDQEYIKKFFPSPEDVVNEIQETVPKLFKDNINIRDVIISEKIIGDESVTLYRNPLVVDTSIEDTKFISIRINFGNINAGKQRAFLLSFLKLVSVKRTLSVLLSDEGFKKILKTAQTESEKRELIEIRNILAKLFFNKEISEEELEDFEKHVKRQTPVEIDRGEIEENDINDIASDLFGYEGIEHSAFQKFIERISEHIGDTHAINMLMLFPEIGKFIESGQPPVGIVELDSISIGDAIEIIDTFKGSSLEEIKAIIKLVANTWNVKINIEETAHKLAGIICYLYWYLKKIKQRAIQIAEFLQEI